MPTPLGGAGIQIRDSRGFERFAPLFFVSPGQINYAIPGNTADGTAQVTVIAADGTTNAGTLEVAASRTGPVHRQLRRAGAGGGARPDGQGLGEQSIADLPV